jgi:hypothetical protein
MKIFLGRAKQMLSLILFEFRSRWSGFLILSSTLLGWDLLLNLGFENYDVVLSFALLYLTSIGFCVIYVIVNAFLFYFDFVTRHALFVSLTPSKIWKILLAKLIPIWILFIVLYSIHSVFVFFKFLSVLDKTNAPVSLTSFCQQLFKMNCFLFLLMTVSLLFFWMGILLLRNLLQNSKAIFGLVVLVLVGGSIGLLYSLRILLVGGLSSPNIQNWSFPALLPLHFTTMFLLSLLFFWINWDLLKKHIDQ